MLLYANSVNINGSAVLIRGASGCGKSDLSLRLIDKGAILISDDQTIAVKKNGDIILNAPETILGKIEIRGFGILNIDYIKDTALKLIIDLYPINEIERMPIESYNEILGVKIPILQLNAFEISAVEKINMILNNLKL